MYIIKYFVVKGFRIMNLFSLAEQLIVYWRHYNVIWVGIIN